MRLSHALSESTKRHDKVILYHDNSKPHVAVTFKSLVNAEMGGPTPPTADLFDGARVHGSGILKKSQNGSMTESRTGKTRFSEMIFENYKKISSISLFIVTHTTQL